MLYLYFWWFSAEVNVTLILKVTALLEVLGKGLYVVHFEMIYFLIIQFVVHIFSLDAYYLILKLCDLFQAFYEVLFNI
jgi:hypothetical protein